MSNFSELGLNEALLKALPDLNIQVPSKIQEQAIPILVQEPEHDFIGLAQTGTGKTAAFGLPLLQAIDTSNHKTQALVLSPTRELGQQIAQQVQSFAKHMKGVKIQVVYGGAPIMNQIKQLKNTPHIIVATPGRLLDLIKRKSINLNNVQYVVLDEADEMLNMGFRDDLDSILSYTDGDRATWLFSATMAGEIRKIVKKYMTSPNEVKIDTGNVVNTNIDHQYLNVKVKDKVEVLKHIIELEPQMRGIIFCRTKRDTQSIAQELQSKGVPIDAIHGDLTQNQRDQVMRRFKNHSLEFLLATDVAARGIDVNDITHVVHMSLPDDLEYYTHRSGRTGRAGKNGISLSLVSPSEQRKMSFIQKKLKIQFNNYKLPDASEVQSQKLDTWAQALHAVDIDDTLVEPFLDQVNNAFEDLSKEDILKRLVTRELEGQKISDFSFDSSSTSASSGRESRKRSDRSDRSDRKRSTRDDSAAFHRFYINVGLVDGMNKKELIDFIANNASIKKAQIGPVMMESRRSFFEVSNEVSKKVEAEITGVIIDGREIRANRDDVKKKKSKKRRR